MDRWIPRPTTGGGLGEPRPSTVKGGGLPTRRPEVSGNSFPAQDGKASDHAYRPQITTVNSRDSRNPFRPNS